MSDPTALDLQNLRHLPKVVASLDAVAENCRYLPQVAQATTETAAATLVHTGLGDYDG